MEVLKELMHKGIIRHTFIMDVPYDHVYIAYLSDKSIGVYLSFQGKINRQMEEIEIPHHKGNKIWTDTWWMMHIDGLKVEIYIIPKHLCKKLTLGYEVIDGANKVVYNGLINKFQDEGFVHYKRTSDIYFTSIPKNLLRVYKVSTYTIKNNVKHRRA